jgi:haloalkane dehalogenase
MANVINENNGLVLDSNFVEVYGAKMHYLSTGKGDPILFLHGMPTSSYLWRNIMPGLSSEGACYAPDMIGMGRSEKMDIAYTIDDHIKYLNGFIRSLNLKNITLVLHAWGSILGFEYARLHPENIKGIAFYESHIQKSS